MRNNSDVFDRYNQAPSRELRLVIEIGYPVPLYLASHSDIPNLPANAVLGCIRKVSSTSQRLQPEKGRAEIGAISFEVVDVGGQVTYVLGDELALGNGLKGREVVLYQGGAGMDWADFRPEQTQVAEESLSYGEGVYKVRCRDRQREMRRDIFTLNSTKLAADFPAGASTLQVFDASAFEPNPHTASYGDAPSYGPGYYYLKIKYQDGYEIVRASGKTATSFTGCVRGLFGTRAVDHTVPSDSDSDRGIEVQEYVYLELPGPAMAYALLTGDVPGTGTPLPSNWHLGIDPALVVADEFLNVGRDWYNPADQSKGRILRFAGLEKADGKQFIETEICLLLGAFMPVNAAGQIGFRRMTGVLANASTVTTLTEQQVVSAGDLQYDLAAVRNIFGIQWSWYEQPGFDGKFVRINNLVDADSISTHGAAKPHTLKFRGLHNSRHTFTSIKNTFDALRDRFAGPPLRLRLDLLPSCNDIEVGDVVRVALPFVRDHSNPAAGDTLDRAMEVQQVSVDQISGRVSLELFGSYQAAGTISDQDTSVAGGGGTPAAAELPDSWYSASGTAMAAAGLSIDGSGFLTADGSLAGGASRTIYYYLGDLTIPAGRTLTISANVELRVMGVLQIDGTIAGTPGHRAPGFIGSTYGGSGFSDGNAYRAIRARGEVVTGRNAVLPPLALENDAGELLGIPDDLQGSGDADGGASYYYSSAEQAWMLAGSGGDGGDGGAGLAVIARGIAFGVSGQIDTSGGNGAPGTAFSGPGIVGVPGGSGGGGAPGGIVLLVDGNNNPLPVLNDSRIPANYGSSPSSPGAAGKDGGSLGVAAARVAFVPKSRAPYADESDPGVDPLLQQAIDDAAAAAQDAAAALDDLDDIAADGVLHQSEKLQLIREVLQEQQVQPGISSRATAFAVATEKTDYEAALGAWVSYLDGLSPAWDDATQATSISRSLFNANAEDYFTKKQALLDKIAQVAGQWADWDLVTGSGKPEDGATVGATNAERILIENSTGVFLEAFADANSLDNWEQVSGSGSDNGVYTSITATVGGRNLYIGNHTGNDEAWFASRLWIPFEEGKLYRFEARVAQETGSASDAKLYLGVQGMSYSGDLVAKDGGNSNGGAHYVGANGVEAEGDGWETYVGYIKGHGSSVGTNGGNSIASPSLMHPDVRFIRPLVIANYPDKSGRVRVDYIRIDVIQVRDQKDLPMVQSDLASVALSAVCTAVDAGSTATINVGAHSVQFGSFTVAYSSGSISGLSFSKKYYVYCDDPEFEGGAVTYSATTNWATARGSNFRRLVDVITTPANGGGSSGGGTLPPEDCVASGMWLLDGLRVDDALAGDLIDVWDIGDDDCKPGAIEAIRPAADVDCVRLVMASGATVECSITTPVTGPDGEVRKAPRALGMQLGVLHGAAPMVWEQVVDVVPIGPRTVYHMSVGNISFAAGTDPAHRVVTHNTYNKP